MNHLRSSTFLACCLLSLVAVATPLPAVSDAALGGGGDLDTKPGRMAMAVGASFGGTIAMSFIVSTVLRGAAPETARLLSFGRVDSTHHRIFQTSDSFGAIAGALMSGFVDRGAKWTLVWQLPIVLASSLPVWILGGGRLSPKYLLAFAGSAVLRLLMSAVFYFPDPGSNLLGTFIFPVLQVYMDLGLTSRLVGEGDAGGGGDPPDLRAIAAPARAFHAVVDSPAGLVGVASSSF